MFIRKKKNPNGTVTIQVIDKHSGTYKVAQNFGVAKSIDQQEDLIRQARVWIEKQSGSLKLDLYSEDKQVQQLYLIQINGRSKMHPTESGA
jgi:hypothetical protein